MFCGARKWHLLITGALMAVVVMVATVIGGVICHQKPVAAQLQAVKHPLGHAPPEQYFECLNAATFPSPLARFIYQMRQLQSPSAPFLGPLARLAYQVRQLQLPPGDLSNLKPLKPPEPSPHDPRPPCCFSLAVIVLGQSIMFMVLQQYKHRLTRRARRIARRYVMSKLKGMLVRSLKTVLTEFAKELMRSVVHGVGKAVVGEVANVVVNEIHLSSC